jgi:glycosyltransferase involved in cell wall biosynthesis
MSYKKRILFVGEASFLNTGFSNIYRQLLQKLAATGKYELAEFGSYARQDHPDVQNFINGRWKFYGNMPMNEQEAQVYNQICPHPRARGSNTNQFGEWKFNSVVADFKPDIVVDIRDWWMLEYQERSVFRPWFKWVVMPTVDAEPQQEEWIQTYENANVVLAYSDFGINTLKRQSANVLGKSKMKVFPKPMRPGVDLSVFKPTDKNDAREHFNLSKDIPIIGTVMRNQSRKLYPDLIDAFAHMKNKYQGNERVDKAVLAIHSAWPDNQHSYDYPRHIMRLESYSWMPYHKKGIRSDVLQTMLCWACKQSHITFAMNLWNKPIDSGRIRLPCPYCGQNEASPPNTGVGFSREELANFYNAIDLYVQCSICEGDGMPIQEAKACKVPTLVMDYTAMREKGRFPAEYTHLKELNVSEKDYTCHKGGDIIEVERYYMEPETSCKRALPSIEDLADKMYQMISDPVRLAKMGEEARECVEENYDWDKVWKQWEFVFDKISVIDRNETWESPVEQVEEVRAIDIPDGMDDQAFINWLYTHVLKYPCIDPNGANMWLQNLKQGVPREQLRDHFVKLGNQQSDATKVRNQIRAQIDGVTVELENKQEWL